MASKELESTIAEIFEVKEKLASLWIGLFPLKCEGLAQLQHICICWYIFFLNMVIFLPFKIAKMSPLTTCH